MSASTESHRKPIDDGSRGYHDAELEAWLAQTLDLPHDLPRHALDARSRAMLALTDHMRESLTPIQPSPDFVRELGMALAEQAGRRHQSLRDRYRRAIWFGLAAAGSMASIVGVVAWMIMQRGRRQARDVVA
jgi:hypothetical protein